MSAVAVEAGLPAKTVAQFAALLFSYIDQLSAASLSGHSEELESNQRDRQRRLEILARRILDGDSEETLTSAAKQADWTPPRTLTALIAPNAHLSSLLAVISPQTLVVVDELMVGELTAGEDFNDCAVLLIPDLDVRGRRRLKRRLPGRSILGPTRPWLQASSSYARLLRVSQLHVSQLRVLDGQPIDTEEHLCELVVTADSEALADLRAVVLAPLATLRPTVAAKLVETFTAWLMHQGRRDDIAAALFVHPQTVRYRIGQLRDLYGDRLTDPAMILNASLALATMTNDDLELAFDSLAVSRVEPDRESR
jgi:hypothetical protein